MIHILVNAIWFFLVATVLGHLLKQGSRKFEQLLRQGSGIVLVGFSFAFAVSMFQAQ